MRNLLGQYQMIQNAESGFEANVFVGRQPILTPDLKTVAYELLYRNDPHEGSAAITDSAQATAELIISSFAEIGIERIVGHHRAFINIPESLLLDEPIFSLPTERVVLEILEDVAPHPEVLQSIQRLKDVGFTIAIDDFVMSPDLLPFVELADIIKIDLPRLTNDETELHVRELRQRANVKLLAEKVETQQEFEFCQKLGFDLYQGYFFCRPTIVEGRRIPVNVLSVIRLIAELRSPLVDIDNLANIIQTEPSLSFKILSYVNAARNGLSCPIESIRHAVVMAGIHRIKSLCCLSLMADIGLDMPEPLIRTVLVRARFAELMAKELGQAEVDSFFLVGLFSALDALLQTTMENALDLIPVCDEVKQALIDHSGIHGQVLTSILDCEQGNWDQLPTNDFSESILRSCFVQAVLWAEESLAE